MNNFKRYLIIILSVIIMISFIGCSTTEPEPVESEDPVVDDEAENEDEEVEDDGAVVITDHLGREVTIEEKPERIVSGYYITSSMLIALELEDNIVGIEARAETRPIYSLAAPELLELPSVGTAKEFDLEGAAALEPDLVILPVRLEDAVNSFEELGITVIAVNPEDMDLLKETIEMIGKATGTEERANELITYYDEKIVEIQDIASESEDTNVYLGGNSDFLSTATGKMYQNFMIETAGATNVASEIDDTYWATVSYEQVIEYNPEIIIIVPEADYTKEDLLADDKLSPIDVIANNLIYTMPDSFEAWDSPVPSGILGTMWLTSILNEEAYPFDNFKDDVVDFYETFYDFTADKEAITK